MHAPSPYRRQHTSTLTIIATCLAAVILVSAAVLFLGTLAVDVYSRLP